MAGTERTLKSGPKTANAPGRMRSKTFYSEGEKELTTKNWASQGLFTLIDQSTRITTQEFNASGQGSGSCQEADQTLIKTKPQTIDWWTRTWFCGVQNRERSESDNENVRTEKRGNYFSKPSVSIYVVSYFIAAPLSPFKNYRKDKFQLLNIEEILASFH